MLTPSDLFHTGIRVAELEAAMDALGAGLGVEWCSVQERDQAVWIPDEGPATIPLRFVYSMEGPLHLELLEGAPGSIWDGRDEPGVHHLGYWCNDVAGTTRTLIDAGWTLELAQVSPADGYGAFTYVRSPDGTLVEPVTTAARPMFERWFAGGPLA